MIIIGLNNIHKRSINTFTRPFTFNCWVIRRTASYYCIVYYSRNIRDILISQRKWSLFLTTRGRIFYFSGRQFFIYHAFFLMTSSVHTLLGRDKVAFKVSLSVIVMKEHALIKANYNIPVQWERFSFGVRITTIPRKQSQYQILFRCI